MRLTNRKIVNDSSFLGNLTQKQLPVKVSYAIAKNITKIEKELDIYNKERQKLIDKYCEKNEDGTNKVDEHSNIRISYEHLENWNKDVNDLLDIEIHIDMHKFNVNDLLNSNCEIAASELMLIDYMIEE